MYWVRYLVKDDPRQHAVVSKFIASVPHKAAFFIPPTVALELEWVLRSRYGVDKSGIIDTYTRLLADPFCLKPDQAHSNHSYRSVVARS